MLSTALAILTFANCAWRGNGTNGIEQQCREPGRNMPNQSRLAPDQKVRIDGEADAF